MEDKNAITILKNLLTNPSLSTKEREAILTAIGILSWSKLAESRIKSIGIRKHKKIE